MRITILALGPRGDVQPLIALAVGLRDAGHTVSVVTHPCYAAIAREANVAVRTVGADMDVILAGDRAKFLRSARASPTWMHVRFIRVLAQEFTSMVRECWHVSQDAELLVVNPLSVLIGLAIGDRLAVPVIPAFWFPFFPTRERAAAGFPPAPLWLGPLARAYNHRSFSAVARIHWLTFRGAINQWRTEVDLPALGLQGPVRSFLRHPSLQAYSANLVRRPADWPDRVHLTGFWFLPLSPNWRPPDAVVHFVEIDPPPVAVALGTMHRGTHHARTIVEALRRAGLRAILTGIEVPRDMNCDEDIIDARDVPHTWLFERVSAIVHHAGGGTTAAALRAGLPSITLPLTHDQPFWAATLHQHGVSPLPILPREVSVQRLVGALGEVATDASMRRRAQELGRRIAAEDGVDRAVQIIGGGGI